VVAIGILAAAALALWLPRGLRPTGHGILHEFRALGRRQVVLAMAISTLASASLFSVFTYIAPLLREVTGVAPATVTLVLLVFGVGLTLGNLLGGRLGDWRLMPVVIVLLLAIAAVLALLPLASAALLPVTGAIFVWGVLAFAVVSPLQLRVVNEAVGAPNLASTLNQGAFNLGNAAGAWISGLALEHGVGYAALPWIGVGIALAAMGCALLSHGFDRQAAPAMGD
jgi:DHA1 family inner membrane transport protein